MIVCNMRGLVCVCANKLKKGKRKGNSLGHSKLRDKAKRAHDSLFDFFEWAKGKMVENYLGEGKA